MVKKLDASFLGFTVLILSTQVWPRLCSCRIIRKSAYDSGGLTIAEKRLISDCANRVGPCVYHVAFSARKMLSPTS